MHSYFLDAPNINGDMDIRAKSQYGMCVSAICSYTWLCYNANFTHQHVVAILPAHMHICILMVMLFIPAIVFKMQNSTGGVNQKCIEQYSSTNETWKCLLIQDAEPFTSSRLFALNSIYDSWQLANILQLPCKPPDCDPRYMEAVEEYGKVRFRAVDLHAHIPARLLYSAVHIHFFLCSQPFISYRSIFSIYIIIIYKHYFYLIL